MKKPGYHGYKNNICNFDFIFYSEYALQSLGLSPKHLRLVIESMRKLAGTGMT